MAEFTIRASTDSRTIVGSGSGTGASTRRVPHSSGAATRLQQAETAHAGGGSGRKASISAGSNVRRTDHARCRTGVRMRHRSGRATRTHTHRMERPDCAGLGWSEPNALGAGRLIQITPQIRILVAVEPIDARKGIDSLAQLCREKLAADPFSGCLFIFRSRRGTAIKLLAYDGQGFWLATKRLSKGRFRWWPTGDEPARVLRAHQAQLLLAAGNPEVEAAPEWRRVSA